MWAKSDIALPAPDMITLYLSIPFSPPGTTMKSIKNGWSILSGLARPTSRGTIKLKFAKHTDAPVIDPNYLASEHDRQVFSKATDIARQTALQPA